MITQIKGKFSQIHDAFKLEKKSADELKHLKGLAEKRAMKEAEEAGLCVFMGLDGVRVHRIGKPYYVYDAFLQNWGYTVAVGDPEQKI